jgi:sugar phosphate isomerase/epimerase
VNFVIRPTLSWFAVRHLIEEVEGRGIGNAWLDQAPGFGFSHVEIHELYLRTPEQEERVRSCLGGTGLAVSQITCAPDFVHPHPHERRNQLELMREKVATAARLGAPNVRVTAGINRRGLHADEALARASELLRELAEDAERQGVVLCLENHFRDRTWSADAIDFTLQSDRFVALVDALRDSPVRVNFDTAQTMLSDVDPVDLLAQVEDRVANLHAGDRIRGQRPHAVIGEGDVDFDAILARLARRGYAGFVTVEDGSPAGDAGLRAGVAHLEACIDRHWAGVAA